MFQAVVALVSNNSWLANYLVINVRVLIKCNVPSLPHWDKEGGREKLREIDNKLTSCTNGETLCRRLYPIYLIRIIDKLKKPTNNNDACIEDFYFSIRSFLFLLE